jgi:tRNA-dihydrouridine synthase B
VPVPVLASGSLHTAAAIRRARDLTGIDGYQIGRAACGNPWIFRDLQAELRGEPPPPRPTLQERRRLLERHLELVLQVHGEALGVRLMRKYTFFYCQGLPGVRRFRDRFVRMESRAGFLNLMEEFFEAQGQRSPGEGVHPLSGGGRRP